MSSSSERHADGSLIQPRHALARDALEVVKALVAGVAEAILAVGRLLMILLLIGELYVMITGGVLGGFIAVVQHLDLVVVRLQEDGVLKVWTHIHRCLVFHVVATVGARSVAVVTTRVGDCTVLLLGIIVVRTAVEVLFIVDLSVEWALVERVVIDVVAIRNIVEDAGLVGVDGVLVVTALIIVGVVAITIIVRVITITIVVVEVVRVCLFSSWLLCLGGRGSSLLLRLL